VVVVNYNSTAATTRLVESIRGASASVVVVDNASPDGAFAGFAQSHPDVTVLELPANIGYGGAANRAADQVEGDVMILCNPDVVADAAALALLADAVRANGVAIAAPLFRFPDGKLQPSAHRRYPGLMTTLVDLSPAVGAFTKRLAPTWHPTLFTVADHARPLDAHHVLGAVMAIDLRAYREVGGFDESFFLYREETDLCLRVRRAGWRVVHVPEAVVVHEGGGSTLDGAMTQARPAHLESHYRFIAKHRGRLVAVVARTLGLLACASWLVTGPDRAAARTALRWHLRGGPEGLATLPRRGAASP
jgi:GT2 family glycosyltransferase